MPILTTENSGSQEINPVTLKQSTVEHQKSAILRAVSSILRNGEQEVYPTQVMMIEDNQFGNINLGELLSSLLETKKREENEKSEGQTKNVSLNDIYSQVIGNLKSLGLDNFIKIPNIRKASDDIRLLSEIIINDEFILRLYKIAYEKQLEQIQQRPEGHYSGKDITSTEKSLKEVNEKLESLEKQSNAA